VARTLLDGRHYATLATHDGDGSLHQTPVWYIFRDEQLFVGTSSLSRKFRNVPIRRNGFGRLTENAVALSGGGRP
jgi:hypothetical protein